MKKIFTTFCAIALTAVVAQAQDADARSAAKTNEVKKEAAATNAGSADAQKANTTVDRASYEAYKQEQLNAREAAKSNSSVKKAGNNSGEVKRITNSEERKQKSSATKKRKLTPEQQKAREEKIKRDN